MEKIWVEIAKKFEMRSADVQGERDLRRLRTPPDEEGGGGSKKGKFLWMSFLDGPLNKSSLNQKRLGKP